MTGFTRLVAFVLVCVAAACSTQAPVHEPLDSGQRYVLSDGSEDVVTLTDGGLNDTATADAATVAYDPCVNSTTFATLYPRLDEVDCVDSNGKSYVLHYIDKQLKITCMWRTTSDMSVRCAPQNEQSAVEYADGACSEAIALVGIDKATHKPLQPYVGVDEKGDAGRFVTYYYVRTAYIDPDVFYLVKNGDAWNCEPTALDFPGLSFYYLDAVVDPTIFQVQ